MTEQVPNIVLDALGDPIVVGQRYGYHTSASGYSRVTTGVAVRATKSKKMTLEDLTVRRFLYGKLIDFMQSEVPHSVSINPSFLFPVYKPMTPADHT